MDLIRLCEEWKELCVLLENAAEHIEKGISESMTVLQEVIEKIDRILPIWSEFIAYTEFGTVEELTADLESIFYGIEKQDEVLLQDAILFGLKKRTELYIQVVNEALA